MFTKRMQVCIAAGAILGVFCIVGAMVRSGFERDALYLFAFWYNRLLMGVVIGLAAAASGLSVALGRGALWDCWFPSPFTVLPASMMGWDFWPGLSTAS